MKKKSYLFIVVLLIGVVSIYLFDAQSSSEVLLSTVFAPMMWKSGQENMGGYKSRIAFIPQDAVSTVPTLPADPKTDADYVTATGAFTFVDTGGNPLPIYATRGTVGFKADIQGEADCKSYKNTAEFFHPGSKIEAIAFAKQICNTPGYLIIDEIDKQILIGQPGFPCTLSASFDGGKAAADKKGWQFTVEADSSSPMIVMGTPIDIDALFATKPVAP